MRANTRFDLALVLSDGWEPALHQEAESLFRETKTAWLRGFAAFGEGVVGPVVRPDRPGCTQCADARWIMAGGNRRETWKIRQQLAERGGIKRDAWSSQISMAHMADLIENEAVRLLHGQPGRMESSMLFVHLLSLRTTRHFVLPEPLCPVCGALPEDSEDQARIVLLSRPKCFPGSYRVKPMEELREALPRDYLDYRTGLLNGNMADLQSPFADASVNLPLPGGDEGAAGRTHRYSDSLLTAILEGLERRCGLMPRGRRPVVRGPWRELQKYALDPMTVGLHREEQYRQPDFPFRPFDPDRDMNWVWGYSFSRQEPILVPEQLAYYSSAHGEGFVYETSNGCALGGSLEEAIFYGLLEVVERDSFLLTWYARLPLPRLDAGSARDAELELMIERMRAVCGFEVLMFNATMEHGIPAIWSMAINKRGHGINLICAAGAHPDPVRAAKSSIHELAAMVFSQNERYEQGRQSYLRMLEDPYLVRAMEDHSMLYALPEAQHRFNFLLESASPVQTFREAYGERSWQPDLTADLNGLLKAIMSCGMDVIVVDQSSPETQRNGLHCVKVIVPGMLPMTFGYHLTRLEGLDRVLNVPARLGYAERPLAPDQLNPHPHPFP
jgi:ribosomal protein S12 methylthiotransferase accessory factor